jgi:exopolysaccharide biosynthesis protein
LKARTTSDFLDEFDLQVAINGGGFSPWWSRGPADFYPHIGDPIAPAGFTASVGDVYWMGDETVKLEPTLYISRKNALSFNNKPNNVYNAISGDRMLVLKGEVAPDLNDKQVDPRTAIGINRNGRYVYIVVVDGRQPFYSQGATFTDLAELLIEQGAYIAMSLDGGGSSTMVIEGRNGKPLILNSPIDNYLPGRERPVGTHLGIYVK